MKKITMTGFAAIAFLIAFTGCSKNDLYDQGAVDERNRQEQEKKDQQKELTVNEKYAAAFEKAFGKVGANVDWGFGRQPSSARALTRGKNDYPSKGTLTADGITFPEDCNPSNFIKEEEIPTTSAMPNYQVGAGPWYIDKDTKQVNSWQAGCVIYVKGDVDLTDKYFELNIDSKIYLTEKSHLKLGSYAADGLNVSFYIAKDAILEVPGHLKIQSYPIYNHGTLNVGSLELCSTKENTSGMLYNVGKLIAKGDVKSDNSKSYIVNDGEISAGSVHIEGQSAFQNNAEWEVTGTTVINCKNGGWVNNGHWKTQNYAYTAGSENVINNCYLWVTNDFEMNTSSNDGSFRIDTGGGVLTKNFYGGRDSSTGAISGPFKIVMGQKAVFKVENIAQFESGRGEIDNDKYYKGIFGPSSGEYAVFQAKTIVREASIANTWGAVTYGGNLYVSAESHFAQGDDGSLNVLHPYIITQGDFTLKNIYAAGDANFSSGKPSITIPQTTCSPGFQGGDPLYRVIAEDLSATEGGDFDFNDVVFDIVKAEGGKTTLKLICAGGVLPLKVMGVEVHGLFGETTPNEKGQYQMYNTGAGPDKDPVTFEVDGTYTTPEQIKNIIIEVQKDGVWMPLNATTGKPACKILVDDTFTPVPERKNIADENGNFTDYVQGKFVNDFWWK